MATPAQDTALSEETGRACECQAALTRLQRVCGVKKRVTGDDLRRIKYGDIPAIPSPICPTGFENDGDVVLVSLFAKIEYEGEEPTSVKLGISTLDTALLQNVALGQLGAVTEIAIKRPQGIGFHCTSASQIANALAGDFRLVIARSLEPPYQLSQEANMRLSELLRAHKIDGRRKNIVLVVEDKRKTLEDLERLGFQPKEHPHIIDIIDISEVYKAYLVRRAYDLRDPYDDMLPGSSRVHLQHDWISEHAAPHHAWHAARLPRIPGEHLQFAVVVARRNLLATVKLAVADATAPAWLRTIDQVDGGMFPGPWRKLSTARAVKDYVKEYHFAVDTKLRLTWRGVKNAARRFLRFESSDDGTPATCRAVVARANRIAADTVVKDLAEEYGYSDLLSAVQGAETPNAVPATAPAASSSSAAVPNSSTPSANAAVAARVAPTIEEDRATAPTRAITSTPCSLSVTAATADSSNSATTATRSPGTPSSGTESTGTPPSRTGSSETSASTSSPSGPTGSNATPSTPEYQRRAYVPPCERNRSRQSEPSSTEQDSSSPRERAPFLTTLKPLQSPPRRRFNADPALPRLRSDDKLPPDLFDLFMRYKEQTERIADIFVSLVQGWCPEALFDKHAELKTEEPKRSDDDPRSFWYISCEAYVLFACNIHKSMSESVTAELLVLLDDCAVGRQQVHEWYLRLPRTEARMNKDERHERFIEALEQVRSILVSDVPLYR